MEKNHPGQVEKKKGGQNNAREESLQDGVWVINSTIVLLSPIVRIYNNRSEFHRSRYLDDCCLSRAPNFPQKARNIDMVYPLWLLFRLC